MAFAEIQLNQHTLLELESWLEEFGAMKSIDDPCAWVLVMRDWSAEIKMEKDSLRVVWNEKGNKKECFFSYGLTRKDVENAILQGP